MTRDDILDYLAQGRLAPEHLRRAMALAGVLPDAGAWRSFVDRLLLWIGTTMLGAAVDAVDVVGRELQATGHEVN